MPSPWVKVCPWYYTGKKQPSRAAERAAALEYEERAEMSHGTPRGQRAPASKSGRNKKKCEKYKLRGIREKNKARRIAKNGGADGSGSEEAVG